MTIKQFLVQTRWTSTPNPNLPAQWPGPWKNYSSNKTLLILQFVSSVIYLKPIAPCASGSKNAQTIRYFSIQFLQGNTLKKDNLGELTSNPCVKSADYRLENIIHKMSLRYLKNKKITYTLKRKRRKPKRPLIQFINSAMTFQKVTKFPSLKATQKCSQTIFHFRILIRRN